MASFKSTFLKIPFVPVFTGLFLALILVSCGQTGDRQTNISSGTNDNFSSPIPTQLEKARPGLTAKVIVDGGTANARTIDLQIVNDQVQGTIPDLSVGQHTFEIQYFIDGVLVATATVNATIQADAATPVPFESSSFVFPDSDGDGASNLNEVEIFGSASNAWNDATTKPEISVVVNPGTAILPPNGVQTFTAAVAQNANQGVTWSVEGGDANGTVTPSGTYTAPAAPGPYNVVATSQADPTKSATIPVTVVNPGSRDLGFDTDGSVDTVIPSSTSSSVQDIAIQSDGKIIAAGSAAIGANHFTLARYNTDGSLDTTFGTGGIVTSPVPSSTNSTIQAVAIQDDGKIIAAGSSTITTTRFTLARYNIDGSLDTSFGTGGFVTSVISTSTSSSIQEIAIQADGKIVAAGSSTIGSSHFTVARYNANGSFDTSFGTGGSVFTAIPTSTSSIILEIAIQADGKIVAAGSSTITSNRFTLVRYEANGGLDNSFGTGGIVTTVIPTSTSSNIQGVAIQPNQKIVVAGFSFIGTSNRFTLARYDANGSLDASFGTGGIVTTEIPTSTNSAALSLALQTDGKIVAAGHSSTAQLNFTLTRYNPDGSPDTSFNGNGVVITTIPTSTLSFIQSVAIQGDGKIIAAGPSTISGTGRFTLARYQTGTTPVLLRATLSGSEEVPAVTTLATGSATFVINPGGTEIAYMLNVSADIGVSKIAAVQLHFGAPGAEGRALFTLTTSPFISPLVGKLIAADLEQIAATEGINTFADAIKVMREDNTYLHVHTSTHLGGEIRGQILEAPPTLSLLQVQIFTPRCASCHTPGGPGSIETGLDLDSRGVSFNKLVNATSTQDPAFKRVEPFNPDASFLIKKLEGSVSGRMPADGPPFLSDEEVKKVRDWISGGAKND